VGHDEGTPLERAAGKKKSRNIGSMGEKTIGWGAAQDAARGASNNSNVLLMLERC
jgi:hypothetical protein